MLHFLHPGPLSRQSTILALELFFIYSGRIPFNLGCGYCLVRQSGPAFCDPMDCSPPGSSVHGILQARVPEWVAISSSGESSQPRAWSRSSCVSCIDRRVLYHWTTTEVLLCRVLMLTLPCVLNVQIPLGSVGALTPPPPSVLSSDSLSHTGLVPKLLSLRKDFPQPPVPETPMDPCLCLCIVCLSPWNVALDGLCPFFCSSSFIEI